MKKAFLLVMMVAGCLLSGVEKVDLSKVEHGILCLTFDDRNFAGWQKALPLFAKYHAHASFFVTGNIDKETAKIMQKLQDAGHTVGLHTKSHCDPVAGLKKYPSLEVYFAKEIAPQLKQCEKQGVKVCTLAYPENRHNPESDALLGKTFERFRAGTKDKPNDAGIPVAEIPQLAVIGGRGLGSYYKTDPAVVEKSIRDAAAKNLFIAYYSHNIQEKKANAISITFELLEMMLKTAEECGMKVVGFEELPRTK